MTRDDAVQKAQDRVRAKAAVVQRVLSTEDGQKMLLILKEEFLFDTRKATDHGAAFQLGRVDVIGYIEQMNLLGR